VKKLTLASIALGLISLGPAALALPPASGNSAPARRPVPERHVVQAPSFLSRLLGLLPPGPAFLTTTTDPVTPPPPSATVDIVDSRTHGPVG
jgi:hypothetical protein